MGRAGLTFDTGALIALHRRKHRMSAVFAAATKQGLVITVPTAVVAEWWRGTDVRHANLLLSAVNVEELSVPLSKAAGEALAAIPSATTIDAVVMASAARRGDIVYTSDVGDLAALQPHFPGVRILRA
ncbi:MAG: PIN domain-containing protein [Myxococcales bacterium]|nr:PIN domain-containing protein [Myxococcales bacterium]